MDIFDQAQELERLARETALQRARSSQYWEGPEWIDGQACCRECGEPIPQKRLEACPASACAAPAKKNGNVKASDSRTTSGGGPHLPLTHSRVRERRFFRDTP